MKNPEVVIRPMRAEDYGEAIAILEYWNLAPRSPTEEIPHPERGDLKTANSFVAVIDGKVVGVCSFIVHNPELVETASFVVHPEFQGKGIGRRLQDVRVREFQRRGFKTVRTETDRPEVIQWLIREYGFQIAGKKTKKHSFGHREIGHWTVLELKLQKLE